MGQSPAQREAAWRRKFDLKDNLGSWNSARSNATWKPNPIESRGESNYVSLQYTERALREGQHERL